MNKKQIKKDFVSGCCKGEKCGICGKDATNKIAEVVFHDDPNPTRHELTAYVCKEHFNMIFGLNINNICIIDFDGCKDTSRFPNCGDCVYLSKPKKV